MKSKEKKNKYLDPKNDLTFRKIFGEHPHLLISFLNSLLPLKEGQLIEVIEYQDIELIPELPGFKRSMVDVRCTDNFKRKFIVEMHMYWTSSFKKRMMFNSGKAYVKQLSRGGKFRDLKPVYGLCLIDDSFTSLESLQNVYYHHYSMVHKVEPSEKIEGLELIFIELPKFKAQNITEKRLQYLWLRFLTEIDENTEEVSEDLQNEELIREALECVQKDAFTPEELEYYDQYWDSIRMEKAALEEINIRFEEAQRQAEESQRQAEESQWQAEESQRQAEESQRQAEESQKREEESQRQVEEAQKREEEAQRQTVEALDKIKYAVKALIGQDLEIKMIASMFKISTEEVKKIIDSQ
jgi:predicted transposase/invertase (TIGR01784 family)